VKSTDVVSIYDDVYFKNSVDGCKEFQEFDGSFDTLFDRYKRNILLLDLNSNHRFLEVGCGRAEICTYHAMKGGEAKGVDFSGDAILLAREKARSLRVKVDFLQRSFEQIDDPDGQYDRILASEFIEHVSAEEGRLFFLKLSTC